MSVLKAHRSPSIKAPTIESVLPDTLFDLISLSLRISNENIMIIASTKAGNGTPSL